MNGKIKKGLSGVLAVCFLSLGAFGIMGNVEQAEAGYTNPKAYVKSSVDGEINADGTYPDLERNYATDDTPHAHSNIIYDDYKYSIVDEGKYPQKINGKYTAIDIGAIAGEPVEFKVEMPALEDTDIIYGEVIDKQDWVTEGQAVEVKAYYYDSLTGDFKDLFIITYGHINTTLEEGDILKSYANGSYHMEDDIGEVASINATHLHVDVVSAGENGRGHAREGIGINMDSNITDFESYASGRDDGGVMEEGDRLYKFME